MRSSNFGKRLLRTIQFARCCDRIFTIECPARGLSMMYWPDTVQRLFAADHVLIVVALPKLPQK